MADSDSNGHGHLLFMMENLLREFSKVRDTIEGFSGFGVKIESLEKRLDKVEKMERTVNQHSEHIAVQKEQIKSPSDNQNIFSNASVNKIAAVIVSVLIGGSVGYKGTSINQDNGTYHENVSHNES